MQIDGGNVSHSQFFFYSGFNFFSHFSCPIFIQSIASLSAIIHTANLNICRVARISIVYFILTNVFDFFFALFFREYIRLNIYVVYPSDTLWHHIACTFLWEKKERKRYKNVYCLCIKNWYVWQYIYISFFSRVQWNFSDENVFFHSQMEYWNVVTRQQSHIFPIFMMRNNKNK